MARIDISQPYETYLQNQVKIGLFRSITAAAEAAIKKEMDHYEDRRIASVLAEVQKGIEDVKGGKTLPYNKNLLDTISQKIIDKHDKSILKNA
jgi:hypothetical protein